MSRDSQRRYGAVNFTKMEYEQIVDRRILFEGLIEQVLKNASLCWEDDFDLRLVVTERFPEDKELKDKT